MSSVQFELSSLHLQVRLRIRQMEWQENRR